MPLAISNVVFEMLLWRWAFSHSQSWYLLGETLMSEPKSGGWCLCVWICLSSSLIFLMWRRIKKAANKEKIYSSFNSGLCTLKQLWVVRESVLSMRMGCEIIWEGGLPWKSMLVLFVSLCVACSNFSSENTINKPTQAKAHLAYSHQHYNF